MTNISVHSLRSLRSPGTQVRPVVASSLRCGLRLLVWTRYLASYWERWRSRRHLLRVTHGREEENEGKRTREDSLDLGSGADQGPWSSARVDADRNSRAMADADSGGAPGRRENSGGMCPEKKKTEKKREELRVYRNWERWRPSMRRPRMSSGKTWRTAIVCCHCAWALTPLPALGECC